MITFLKIAFHIVMEDDQEIAYASPIPIAISSLYMRYTTTFDWQDGRQILSSWGIESPQLSMWSKDSR